MANKIVIEGEKELLAKLEELGIGMSQILEAATKAGAEIWKEKANQAAPGPNIESETVKVTDSRCEVDVGPDKQHWYYQFSELGAQPHEIDPKNMKALYFGGTEGEIFTRLVKHPGMAADPFLRPAADQNQEGAKNAMGQRFNEVIERQVE